jgi:outer membrane protein assembly factor BamE (lipoprotein component of BamABCDE complex)
MRQPLQFSLRSLFIAAMIAAMIVACGTFLFHKIAGPVFPNSHLRQVQPGLTKQQVIGILGEPSVKTDTGEYVYERWGNPGWVAVYFGDDGIVTSIDVESAFP